MDQGELLGRLSKADELRAGVLPALLEAGMATRDGRDARLNSQGTDFVRPGPAHASTARWGTELGWGFIALSRPRHRAYGALVPVGLVLFDPPIMFPGP